MRPRSSPYDDAAARDEILLRKINSAELTETAQVDDAARTRHVTAWRREGNSADGAGS